MIPGKGRGVISTRVIGKGELVESSPLIVIPPSEVVPSWYHHGLRLVEASLIPSVRLSLQVGKASGTIMKDYLFSGMNH